LESKHKHEIKREGKEKLSHRLIDEGEITSCNLKIHQNNPNLPNLFPQMGFWRVKPRLNLPNESLKSTKIKPFKRGKVGPLKHAK